MKPDVPNAGLAPILLAGGGTGGHVFPLLALAEVFREIAPQIPRVFVGTERGLEAKVVRERGEWLETLRVEPIQGRNIVGQMRGAIVAGASLWSAQRLLARLKPQLVVSIGGYAAGPVTLAAAAMGIKVALLEPNAIHGLTQKILRPLSRRVYVNFAEPAHHLGNKARLLGVPLRPGFSSIPPLPRATRPLSVLVMGGSQGAKHLNETVPEALLAVSRTIPVQVKHQAGRGHEEAVTARYSALMFPRTKDAPTFEYEVSAFLTDVPNALAQADLVIARAGAITCAELCAVGRPAVLVPYPFAADDHQAKNAAALEAQGAAIMLLQRDATADTIANAVRTIAADDTHRLAMAQAARLVGRPNAAHDIALDLLALCGLSLEPSDANVPANVIRPSGHNQVVPKGSL